MIPFYFFSSDSDHKRSGGGSTVEEVITAGSRSSSTSSMGSRGSNITSNGDLNKENKDSPVSTARKILSRASEVGFLTNPPWAPGSDKTRARDPLGPSNKLLKIKKDGPTTGPVLL